MFGGPIHRFFTNVICSFVPNKDARKKLRVILNSPIIDYIKFIKRDTGIKSPRIKTFIGYQARNLIIGVNDKYIYKFPLRRKNSRELALREKRIVDVFEKISSIPIPSVELIEYRGKIVRKYDFISGVSLRHAPIDLMLKHKNKLARQVARFLNEIASADPAEIRDLKPDPNARPGFMTGWCQGDICDNFIIDLKTMNVIAFIDWEDCAWMNFENIFKSESREPGASFMAALAREYRRLYNKK